MGKLLQIDWSQAVNFDDTELFLYQLTDRQAMLLLGQTDYLAWKTRYNNLLIPDSDLIEIRDRINYQLMTPITPSINCEDIEDCLQTSVTITNINNNITNIENDVTNNTTNITNNTTNITNVSEQVTEISETAVYNEYPPAPSKDTDTTATCGSAWYIANFLNGFLQDVITDQQTITFVEFVTALVSFGGFKTSVIKLLWDYLVANANPSLSSEISSTVEDVAEAFYCADLNSAIAIIAIQNDNDMTQGARDSYVSLINSLTLAKYNELVYLGSLDTGQDCSAFDACGEDSGIVTFDDENWQNWASNGGLETQSYGNPAGCLRNSGLAPAGGNIGRARIQIYIPETAINTVDLDCWSIWGNNEYIFVRVRLYDALDNQLAFGEQQQAEDGQWISRQFGFSGELATRIEVDALQSTASTSKNFDIRLDNIGWNL